MKSAALLAFIQFLLIFLQFTRADEEVEKEYEKFIKKYNKTFLNYYEMYESRYYFAFNYKKIKINQKQFELGLVTFQMDINEYADKPPSTMRTLAGNVPAESVPVTGGRAIGVVPSTRYPRAPDYVDWRPTGCISPVKDQSFFCKN